MYIGVTPNGEQHFTIVFNTFVFCQIFNEINARNIGNEMNVFRGLVANPIFMAIIIFTVIAQYGLVEYGGGFVRTVHLDPSHWYKCILLGALSLPVGGLMRLIPCEDSKTDFAAVSPIIKTPVLVKTTVSSDSLSSPSFILWLLTVTVIPFVTYSAFEEHWGPVLKAFLLSLEHLRGGNGLNIVR
jgi:hypothetical protein